MRKGISHIRHKGRRGHQVEVSQVPYSARKRKAAIALLGLLIIVSVGIGSTLAYFTAIDKQPYLVPIERLSISLDENWDAKDGIEYQAGLTAEKSPTLKMDEGASYARVCVRLIDGREDAFDPIIDTDRLDLIMSIFYYDSGGFLNPGTSYSKEELKSLSERGAITSMYDPDTFTSASYAGEGTYYFECLSVLNRGDSALLFNRVVIPSDISNEEYFAIGSFTVEINGEAIQSFGFTSSRDAFSELDRIMEQE